MTRQYPRDGTQSRIFESNDDSGSEIDEDSFSIDCMLLFELVDLLACPQEKSVGGNFCPRLGTEF